MKWICLLVCLFDWQRYQKRDDVKFVHELWLATGEECSPYRWGALTLGKWWGWVGVVGWWVKVESLVTIWVRLRSSPNTVGFVVWSYCRSCAADEVQFAASLLRSDIHTANTIIIIMLVLISCESEARNKFRIIIQHFLCCTCIVNVEGLCFSLQNKQLALYSKFGLMLFFVFDIWWTIIYS